MYDSETGFELIKAEAGQEVDMEFVEASVDKERIMDNFLGVQHALVRLMVPGEIQNEFKEANGEEVGSFGDFISMCWFSKYSKLFRIYVDQIQSPQEEENEERIQFRQRLISGLLTPADYETIRTYLESPENESNSEDGKIGGKFLATEKEIHDLREEYKMSLN